MRRWRMVGLAVATVWMSMACAAAPTPTPTVKPVAAQPTAPAPAAGKPTVAPPPSSAAKPIGKQWPAAPAMAIETAKKYQAIMTTSKGALTVELFAKEAPTTVNNFVFLAKEGFYDGVIFHRVIKGFMIQGGDPTGSGAGGPGYKFNDEPITRSYLRGTLAMANAGPNTNGSQFFIVHQDAPQLPKNYVIFGQVTAGLEVLDTIANGAVVRGNEPTPSKPVEPVQITKVEIKVE